MLLKLSRVQDTEIKAHTINKSNITVVGTVVMSHGSVQTPMDQTCPGLTKSQGIIVFQGV